MQTHDSGGTENDSGGGTGAEAAVAQTTASTSSPVATLATNPKKRSGPGSLAARGSSGSNSMTGADAAEAPGEACPGAWVNNAGAGFGSSLQTMTPAQLQLLPGPMRMLFGAACGDGEELSPTFLSPATSPSRIACHTAAPSRAACAKATGHRRGVAAESLPRKSRLRVFCVYFRFRIRYSSRFYILTTVLGSWLQ